MAKRKLAILKKEGGDKSEKNNFIVNYTYIKYDTYWM